MSDPMRNVSPEDVAAAAKRYPGMPGPLAIARYMLDREMESPGKLPLQPGASWGGVHLERVGVMVQKLAQAVYGQRKKAITVRLVSEDYPYDYDHWGIEVVSVEADPEQEKTQGSFAGWPCCSCDETIKPDDSGASAVMLDKLAKWQYPSWGSFVTGQLGRASAVLCGTCADAGKLPRFAIKLEGEKYVRVPIEELEDLNGNKS